MDPRCQLHDRMPATPRADDYDPWLDPGVTDASRVADCLTPFDSRLMRCYPVSSRVNHVANDDAECSKPVELAQIHLASFLK
jgi:putative SOS response-associated peptidase YedK